MGNQKVEEGDIALLALVTVRAARTDTRKEHGWISFHLIKDSCYEHNQFFYMSCTAETEKIMWG